MTNFYQISRYLGGECFESLLQIHYCVVISISKGAHVFQRLVGLVQYFLGVLFFARFFHYLHQFVQLLCDSDGEEII